MRRKHLDKGHIVHSFDDDLNTLASVIIEMGGIAETQLSDAIKSVGTLDYVLAEKVVGRDQRLDKLEIEVDAAAIKILAQRQPMAEDLRQVVTALKIAHMVERIGDYSKNIAKRATILSALPPLESQQNIPRMGQIAQKLLKDVLDAYIERNADQAIDVWQRDRELDEVCESVFREIQHNMAQDSKYIASGTHVLFMAQSIERIGDYTTNIAEMVYFLVNGEPLNELRPKGDWTTVASTEFNSVTTSDSDP